MHNFNKTLIAVAVTCGSFQAAAAGFQLNSQSATGIGRAFAGDAVIADNASVMARNPSAMAMFDSSALSVGMTVGDIQIDVKDVNFAGGAVDLGGIDDAGSVKVIPNIYYIQPLNDKWAFGVAAFSNFGTGTETNSLAEGAAVAPYDLIGKTEVTTVDFNVSLSYRINQQWSVGIGLDTVYGKGKLTRYAGATPLLDVDADGVGFGGIVGVTFEMDDNNRFALSYRKSPKVTVKGDISVLTSQEITGLSTQQVGIDFDKLDVPLADIAQFAGFHQLTPTFAVHYTAQFTRWGSFDQITAKDGTATIATGDFAGMQIATGVESALKEYQWQDSWLGSIGMTYSVNPDLKLRAGYMYDRGVVDQLSSLSIPDSNRHWYTVGLGYQWSKNASIDLGVALVKGTEVELVEQSRLVGPVNAKTKSSATYYSVQYSYRF
ncbi:aromatic hydrocarbon degradation protein [Shewanella mangrovi]|uniref:Aromatic hydrocarbon degradation protein n=1 Tax=Shewanella mangrovi TaxID=1515746 RepID=A0A094JIY9_9GAMM|nr:OmpP1/FadL family transporter [Shewanella mangrovi]KFZ38019.1 aromatic hydrocarbon degradation protein [Shewanella mangrovi]